MNHKKLSVIIPVYNSQKYLRSCVDSIRRQTYPHLEIILVDDGSTDGSALICDQLAKEDNRILSLHKENGGTSSARNFGIRSATGDYTTFMDNDDLWKSETAIEEIMAQLDEGDTDVLFHENMIYWQDKDQYITPKQSCQRSAVFEKSKSEALSSLIGAGLFSLYCVWSKVMKTSLIKENNVVFPEKMRNEDIAFCAHLLRVANTFDYYEKNFYLYRKGHLEAQTVQSIRYCHLKDLQVILTDYVHTVEAAELPDTEKELLLSYVAFPYCVWMGQSSLVEDKTIKDDLPAMKQLRYLLNYSMHPSVKKVRLFYGIFGYKITCKFLGFYIKRNNHM